MVRGKGMHVEMSSGACLPEQEFTLWEAVQEPGALSDGYDGSRLKAPGGDGPGMKAHGVELSVQTTEPPRAVAAASLARHSHELPACGAELCGGADVGAARLGLLAKDGQPGEPRFADSACVGEKEAGSQAEAGEHRSAGTEVLAAGEAGNCAGVSDGSPRALQRALSDPQSALFRTLSSVPEVLLCQQWVGVRMHAAVAPHPGSASALSTCVYTAGPAAHPHKEQPGDSHI